MNYIYWLSQIQFSEQSLVGNQLYILSQLLQHDCAVMPGFVISNHLLRQFLINSDNFQSLIRELSDSSFNLDVQDYTDLQSIANRSRQIINQATLSQSATKEILQAAQQLHSDCLSLEPFFSYPSGQSVPNRGFWHSYTCNFHPQALTKTIKAVWSDLFTANSLIYRSKKGLTGQKINLNILVRPLHNVDASGIVEITPDVIKIKAVWGHEKSLFQGDVESDEYYLDRYTGEILFHRIGHKNYAYRIKQNNDQNPLLDCLEAYVPDEIHTRVDVLEQAALFSDWHQKDIDHSNVNYKQFFHANSSKAIIKLFQLTKSVLEEQPEIKYFVWNKLKAKADHSLNFIIKQLGKNLLISIDSFHQNKAPIVLTSSDVKPLLKGISVSPGKVIASVVVIEELNSPLESIPTNAILVINHISEKHIALIKNYRGIITEVGSQTSHSAIVARELKIPAMVNATGATDILNTGMEIFLDGDQGLVYPATAVQDLPKSSLSSSLMSSRRQLIATKLMVNISQWQSIASSINLPIDGVGLLRSEMILSDIIANKSREEWQSNSFQAEFTSSLKRLLHQCAVAYAPRPVFYRSLDINNPAMASSILGSRGTYSYRANSTLFALELDALSAIAKEGHHNLRLILPFVRSAEEFKFCYRLIESKGLIDHPSFQVWIMAEVPSVLWLLPEYIDAGVQGIAIGTNDLTQLILGVDREQTQFKEQGLNANHPVVLKAIAQLIAIAKSHNIDSCICGQAPVEYPDLIDKLIEWGITTISVEPTAVNRTHQAIARAERRILLNSLKLH